MIEAARNTKTVACFVLCALFLATSVAGSLHLAVHDATAPPGNSCSVCLGAGQLDLAPAGDPAGLALAPLDQDFSKPQTGIVTTVEAPAVRQRGPPEALAT